MKTLAMGLVMLVLCLVAQARGGESRASLEFRCRCERLRRRRGRRVEGWHKVNAGKVRSGW